MTINAQKYSNKRNKQIQSVDMVQQYIKHRFCLKNNVVFKFDSVFEMRKTAPLEQNGGWGGERGWKKEKVQLQTLERWTRDKGKKQMKDDYTCATANVEQVKVISPFYSRHCHPERCSCLYHRKQRLAKLDCNARIIRRNYALKTCSTSLHRPKLLQKENYYDQKYKQDQRPAPIQNKPRPFMRQGEQIGLKFQVELQNFITELNKFQQERSGREQSSPHKVRTAAKDIFQYIFKHIDEEPQKMNHYIQVVEKDKEYIEFYKDRYSFLQKKMQQIRASRIYLVRPRPTANEQTALFPLTRPKKEDFLRKEEGKKDKQKLSHYENTKKKTTKKKVKNENNNKNKKKKKDSLKKVDERLLRRMVDSLLVTGNIEDSFLKQFLTLQMGEYEANLIQLREDIAEDKYNEDALVSIKEDILQRMVDLIEKSDEKLESQKETMLQDAIDEIEWEAKAKHYSGQSSARKSAGKEDAEETDNRILKRGNGLKRGNSLNRSEDGDQNNVFKSMIPMVGQLVRKAGKWQGDPLEQQSQQTINAELEVLDTDEQQSLTDDVVADHLSFVSTSNDPDSKLAHLRKLFVQKQQRMNVLEAYLRQRKLGELLVQKGDCLITTKRKVSVFRMLLKEKSLDLTLKNNIKEYLSFVEELSYLKHESWALYKLRNAQQRLCHLPSNPNSAFEKNKSLEQLLNDLHGRSHVFYHFQSVLPTQEQVFITYKKPLVDYFHINSQTLISFHSIHSTHEPLAKVKIDRNGQLVQLGFAHKEKYTDDWKLQ